MQKRIQRVVAGGLAAALCYFPFAALAGSEKKSIVIRDQGNFYVGGQLVQTPYNDTCKADPCEGVITKFPAGTIQVDEAYVDYQFPKDKSFKFPIAFAHGGGHHGGWYESTPDRREGWRSYFVRAGFDTYVIDSVNRGRSGYDIRHTAAVAWGDEPPSAIERVNNYTLEQAWVNFRIGPSYLVQHPGSQFPKGYFTAYAGNMVPAFRGLSEIDRNIHAFKSFLNEVGPVVMAPWSQSGTFTYPAALQAPDKVAAIVSIEAGYPDLSTQANIDIFKKIPMLFVLGDNMTPAAIAQAKDAAKKLVSAGGVAKALILPEAGLKGNSHVLVVEKNNLKIADLVIDWLNKNVKRGKIKSDHDDDDDDHNRGRH